MSNENEPSVEDRVKRVVAEQLGLSSDDVQMSSNFVDDLGADSLDQMELVMAIEDEFEKEIPDEQAERVTTVQEVVDYIKSVSKE